MLVARERNTNVVCSFYSSHLNDALREYIGGAKMDAVRLIPEGGEVTPILHFVETLRQIPAQERVPVMVDILSNPQAYIVDLADPQTLEFGRFIRVGCDDRADLKIKTSDWEGLFKVDAQVFFGYGTATCRVKEFDGQSATLECIQGGTIHEGMNLFVPEKRRAPRLSDLENIDLQALASQVDYLVVPAFEKLEDFVSLKEKLETHVTVPPWLILKINSEESYQNLWQVLPYVRGVVVSRLEIAMTMDPAQVPMVTKEIIQACNDQAKIVLVASEMLGSMRYNATPTRAEVSDIANAVMDGADGVILSEDLGFGPYLDRGLKIARKAVEDIEESSAGKTLNWIKQDPAVNTELSAITYTAYRTALRNKAKAIVCITKSGNTALHLASFRQDIPIIAITLSESVRRRLSLIRGVEGFHLEAIPNLDEVLPLIKSRLLTDTWLEKGDKIVFVSITISSVDQEASNLFTIQTLD